MSINQSNLKLLKYLQEHEQGVSLQKAASHFHKNPSSIRREIASINSNLTAEQRITIKAGIIYQHLHYHEYTSFIQSLQVYEYAPTIEERLQLIIIEAFFKEIVNLTSLYQNLGISLTTKKSDRKKLDAFLEKKQLMIEIKHKKGICIKGDELRFRILAVQLLLPFIELDEHYHLTSRKANTPYEQLMVRHMEKSYEDVQSYCKTYIEEFLEEYHITLTYSSKKFLLLYTAFSVLRKQHHAIQKNSHLPVQPLNLYFFPNHYENNAFNHMIAMLDSYPAFDFPENHALKELCVSFLKQLEATIITNFYTFDDIVKEIYDYMYKQIFCITYSFTFYDKMVRNTKEHIPELYANVQHYAELFETYYAIHLEEEQLSTLTLILKKWINRNKINGRNRKNIVIVTNTSFERIHYFVEILKEQIECRLIAILNINELSKLQGISYDDIITFSDRIQDSVAALGYPSIKLNYFIENSDIELLIQHGFSKTHQHFLSDRFADLLENKDKHLIKDILRKEFPDTFI